MKFQVIVRSEDGLILRAEKATNDWDEAAARLKYLNKRAKDASLTQRASVSVISEESDLTDTED